VLFRTQKALPGGPLCKWCLLGNSLDVIMAGDVDLSALKARLVGAARPDSIVSWLSDPRVRELLGALASGEIGLSHVELDKFGSRRIADHLRGMLVSVGLLPPRDEHLARFDRWVTERLGEYAGTDEDLQVLQAFAAWGLRRHLVTRSESAPLQGAQVDKAKQYLRVAGSLLTWLSEERGHDLAGCTQNYLDSWCSTGTATRIMATPFIRWTISTSRCPKFKMDKRPSTARTPLDHSARLGHLRQLLDPSSGHIDHRVAGVLLVLFGQPFTRMARLTLDDVVADATSVGIHLGKELVPVPPPFATMFRELLSHRPNLTTATNPTSRWLFPGRIAGCHITPDLLRIRVRAMGIDNLAARSGALRQLVLDCPPTVIAEMLGYHSVTIEHHAVRAGSRWASYAALRADQGASSLQSDRPGQHQLAQ